MNDNFREIEENAAYFGRNISGWRPSFFVDFRSREVSPKYILKKFIKSKLFFHITSPITKISLNVYRKNIIRALIKLPKSRSCSYSRCLSIVFQR